MEFLGISPIELIAILVIVFLVMGPKDLVKIGGTLGRALRSLRTSDTWRAVQDASRQLRELPDSLAKQAGIEEIEKLQQDLNADLKEQKKALQDIDRQITAWTRTPDPLSQKNKPQEPEKPNGEAS